MYLLDEVALNILRPLLFLCISHLQNYLYCCFKNALRFTPLFSCLVLFNISQFSVTKEQRIKENTTCKISLKNQCYTDQHYKMTFSFTFPIKRLNKASKCKDKITYLRNPPKYLWGGVDALVLQLMGIALSGEFYISK